MSKYWKATIHVLVEADSEGEACDAVAEGMQMSAYCWVDWEYDKCQPPVPFLYKGDTYAEGDFLRQTEDE